MKVSRTVWSGEKVEITSNPYLSLTGAIWRHELILYWCKGNARVGCIKDPNISIEAGVQEFKDVLGKVNGDIALALQSYNCATRS
ncbi:hypothetical protein LQK80_35510 [Bacillus thuringiensis]|nr:hypothetical protein [Bacillus thuringiensis]